MKGGTESPSGPVRVMMCSNDITFCPPLCHAYARRGASIAAGIPNLFSRLGDFDIVHFHWPEELVGFRGNSADPTKTDPVLELIDWWRERSLLVATVHNLVPHSTERTDGPDARYYAAFYERMDVICHFSEYSRRRFAEVYPTVDQAKQVVHQLNRFDHLFPLAEGKSRARAALGLAENQRVFAVIGAVRNYGDMALIDRAWRMAADRDMLLLIATPLHWRMAKDPRSLLKRALSRLRLWGKPVRYLDRFLSDKELVQVVEAADAILLARSGHHLNSGLFPLAMSFGTPLIAADYGIYSELLGDGANELFAPGDAQSLARAIRAQAAKDPAQAVAENLERSAAFGWDAILERIWPAIAHAQAARLRAAD